MEQQSLINSLKFKKITPINGFDKINPDNAKQNNYAWSMAELDGYLYIGTARNIAYTIFHSGLFPDLGPTPFDPINPTMLPEIWRYKLDGSKPWERVFQARPGMGLEGLGLRYMIKYKNALYVGCTTASQNIVVLKSTNGINWIPLYTTIPGNSTRAMAVHDGKLYMGVVSLDFNQATLLYVSEDPEKDGWLQIDVSGNPLKNPSGGINALASFNDHLYMAVEGPKGFEVWRTWGMHPEKDQWKLIVDKGAGDSLNQAVGSVGVFKNHLYVGSAMWLGVMSIDPEKAILPPKGFDVIRIDHKDNWELVVGGAPIDPGQPTVGCRGKALSGYPSGFGNLTNAYCWQIQKHGPELYIGTFDESVAYHTVIPLIFRLLEDRIPYETGNYFEALKNYLCYLISPLLPLIPSIKSGGNSLNILLKAFEKNFGFDLWKSHDGIHWFPVSLDGLGNKYNYGARTLFSASNEKLYLGTANPYEGCEVWVKSSRLPFIKEDFHIQSVF